MSNTIYLDNAASSPALPEIVKQFPYWLSEYYANPEATHIMGNRSAKAVKLAENSVRQTLNAPSNARVIWTGTATEAMNLAIRGYCGQFKDGEVLSTQIEHKAVMEPVKMLASTGLKPSYMTLTKEGLIDLDKLADQLNENVRLIAFQHVNNEIGLIQPLAEICKLRDKLAPKAAILLDAAQSYGKIPINWQQLKLDFLVTTAHKINAVNGTAILVADSKRTLIPQIIGGGQQKGLRAGTMNVPGVVAFAEAAKLAHERMQQNHDHTLELQNFCRQRLDETFGDKVIYHASIDNISPHILSFAIKGYQGAILMRALSEHNIIVGTGSACMAEAPSGSYVLQALGVSKEIGFSTLRVSFGPQNCTEEIDKFVTMLQVIIAQY